MKKYLLLGYLWVFTSFTLFAQVPTDITADPNATVDELFEITFTDGETWRLGITQISFGDDVLDPGSYDFDSANKIVFDPSASAFLRVDTTLTMTIQSSEGNGTVSQTIGHGAATKFTITTQPAAPATNGAALAAQP
ncbi:hemoblobin-interacting domain-containing protein, partial [Marinifilum sp. D737]|uniref:hemoblobin-interacting domain-containing protein n=1 Tax=Marinifilum sp. D737 TaxID=2969628 RepID=UPI0022730D26